MKKLLALGLAAAMAVSTVAVSTDANAKPVLAAPAPVSGLPALPPIPTSGRGSASAGRRSSSVSRSGRSTNRIPTTATTTAACMWSGAPARYRTYNPGTNTFFIRKGVPAVCVSPYWHY